ncbi:uncharacterized protein LOC122552429 isoform X2 [Chiloscyllium plagiosum]|uniref:uncharacterized protein LOC122552429 isoform X2 n=1 Tax=Chiloscyllium plagiosum TaxID=36176 RepID=UPI001CB878FB|nr:uncharacterized protein LOC122552429 isoform X2 [Chiloscyllium plagiosum]
MNVFTRCALFHLLPVIVSETVFLQTPPIQSVSVGSTIKLHCHTGWFASGAVLWYKRHQREYLQLVYIVRKDFPQKQRFSGEINKDASIYSLVIEDVQRHDSGQYYCAARKSYGTAFIFGNGSTLHIAAGPSNILMLYPSRNEFFQMDVVPLICLVKNVKSKTLTIHWNASTWNSVGSMVTEAIDSDGAYSIISHIRVPTEAWNHDPVCSCSAEINSKEILISECVSQKKGNWKTAVLRQTQETVYADLAFTADPTF